MHKGPPGIPYTRPTVGLIVLIVCAFVGVTGAATAQVGAGVGSGEVSGGERWEAGEAATAAAVDVLREAVTVRRDGGHNRMLQALRHRRDPGLRPLFERLSRAGHPALRLHGLLGLAETADPAGLSLPVLVDVEPATTRDELVGAGLDAGLIDHDTALRLLAWPGLDRSVKLLLATHLIAAGRFGPDAPGFDAVVAALEDPNPGQRGLAALLLHQLGDERGTAGLIALDAEPGPARDAVRAILLETAAAQGLHRAGTWAYAVSTEPDLAPRLDTLALQVALRFGDARALRDWTRRYTEALPEGGADGAEGGDAGNTGGDISARTRLALVGLYACPGLPAGAFDVMHDDPDPFVQQVGRTAEALAAGPTPEEAGDAVAALVALQHPLANGWAMDYSTYDAPEAVAAAIAAAVVGGYEPGDERGRARRLDAVMRAAELLAARDADAAAATLGPGLADPQRDPLWKQVVLLGLIRSEAPAAADLAAAVHDANDPEVAALALVLRLNRPDPLTPEEGGRLERLVEDSATLEDALRARVAWAMLKRSGWTGRRVAEAVLP